MLLAEVIGGLSMNQLFESGVASPLGDLLHQGLRRTGRNGQNGDLVIHRRSVQAIRRGAGQCIGHLLVLTKAYA